VYLQCACLYTNMKGQRMIRVITLATPTTSSLSTSRPHTDRTYERQTDNECNECTGSPHVNGLDSFPAFLLGGVTGGWFALP